MGVLDLLCVTTDPDATTFYAFAYASEYNCNISNSYCYNNVLIKSNTNPTDPKAITWTLVSRIDSKNMMGSVRYVYKTDFSCIMNAQGVFTMFGWNRDLDDNGSVVTPFGLRYDPAGKMDAKYNFKGPGAWMNLTVERVHDWTSPSAVHSLGYINNGEVVHVLLNEDAKQINIAKLDESTQSLTSVGKWTMVSLHKFSFAIHLHSRCCCYYSPSKKTLFTKTWLGFYSTELYDSWGH
jgi:hypothetical protein